jgi:hypothetical protein
VDAEAGSWAASAPTAPSAPTHSSAATSQAAVGRGRAVTSSVTSASDRACPRRAHPGALDRDPTVRAVAVEAIRRARRPGVAGSPPGWTKREATAGAARHTLVCAHRRRHGLDDDGEPRCCVRPSAAAASAAAHDSLWPRVASPR